jgi:2,4-dienoyl-CoA reductase-like NADH-dependent reductase (Old Yellow Enzyme family)
MEVEPAGISVGGTSVGGMVAVGMTVGRAVFVCWGSGVAPDGNIPVRAAQAIREMETREITRIRTRFRDCMAVPPICDHGFDGIAIVSPGNPSIIRMIFSRRSVPSYG